MTLHIKRKRSNGTLADVVKQMGNAIRTEGAAFADESATKMVLGLESMTDSQFSDFESTFASMESRIQDIYSDALGENGHLTPAQKAAGAITAMAYGDPKAYAKAGISGLHQVSQEGLRVVEPNMAGQDFRYQASMEAFDEQELRQHLPFSIAFNVQAARQDEFSETFYPTVVVTPDQAGLDIIVRRTMVFNEVRHTLTGTSTDFDKRNLIDAVIDHRILASESVKAIPYVLSGGEPEQGANNANFVASADVPVQPKTVDGITFDTAPLVFGKEINLIGLSNHPGLITQGIMDVSDSLDARIALETVYVKTTNLTDISTIGLNVSRFPYSAFTKQVEGNYRSMTLNFNSKEVTISAATTDAEGDPLAAAQLAFFSIDGGGVTHHVKLKVKLSGSVNTEFGNIEIHVNTITVDSVWRKNADGSVEDVSATLLAAAITAFGVLTGLGYDVQATRSNQNRRVRGLLVDTTEQVERHTVLMGSPITILSPVTGNRDASDLTSAVAAARIRNSNQAVTTLEKYVETLEGLAVGVDRTTDIPEIEGAGRWLVRPFFERITLDLLAQINSTKSHERQQDVSAAIVNAIREVAYRMYRQSGYQPALDAVTGGTGEKPRLVIGTDPVIANHLQLTGDTRLAGIAMDYVVVTSMDTRVYDKIYLTFTRPGQTGPDPLSFGTHVWIPELAGTVQVSRGGSTVKEAQVQPRNRHINNLPVAAVIDVQNLAEAVTDKVANIVIAP